MLIVWCKYLGKHWHDTLLLLLFHPQKRWASTLGDAGPFVWLSVQIVLNHPLTLLFRPHRIYVDDPTLVDGRNVEDDWR